MNTVINYCSGTQCNDMHGDQIDGDIIHLVTERLIDKLQQCIH